VVENAHLAKELARLQPRHHRRAVGVLFDQLDRAFEDFKGPAAFFALPVNDLAVSVGFGDRAQVLLPVGREELPEDPERDRKPRRMKGFPPVPALSDRSGLINVKSAVVTEGLRRAAPLIVYKHKRGLSARDSGQCLKQKAGPA